jgi:hypothetical protein
MATYQITAQGTPIYPFTLQINAPINVSQTLSNSITVSHAQNSPEFDAVCQAYTLNAENAYKTLPEFSVQDASRNGTYSVQASGGLEYIITMSWTIQNAEIQLGAVTQTDLEGQARQDLFQILSDSKVADYKTQWSWVDL